MSSTSTSGRWIGYYLQGGHEAPITADLVESGEQLSGFMYDLQPDRSCSVSQIAAEIGLPPGADEDIQACLHELAPDVPMRDMRYVTHLPPNSILKGSRKGNRIYFLKSYQGVHYGGYQVGDRMLGVRNADHSVHYEGLLTPDGQVIDGRWWIDAKPETRSPRVEGLFRLHRSTVDAPGAPPSGGNAGEGRRPWWKFWG